jgi:hypothetical protein
MLARRLDDKSFLLLVSARLADLITVGAPDFLTPFHFSALRSIVDSPP